MTCLSLSPIKYYSTHISIDDNSKPYTPASLSVVYPLLSSWMKESLPPIYHIIWHTTIWLTGIRMSDIAVYLSQIAIFICRIISTSYNLIDSFPYPCFLVLSRIPKWLRIFYQTSDTYHLPFSYWSLSIWAHPMIHNVQPFSSHIQ